MSDHIWYIGFAVSLVFTVYFGILTARKVFRTGVEYFSSRILILSGIVNICLCGLLFLSQGSYQIFDIITSGTIDPAQILIPAIFMALPVRILWNYFWLPTKPIRLYGLKQCDYEGINKDINILCRVMDIASPAVLFSENIKSPFVFGHRSSRAAVAVPQSWLNRKSGSDYIQLLHELSHIRNRDVGFLAFSNAVLRDLKLLLVCFPAVIIYSLIFDQGNIFQSIVLYLACCLILFTMLRFIVRKRESLADSTAAMMIESDKVKEVIESGGNMPEFNNTAPDIKPKLAENIQRWLSDKALFARRQKLWQSVLNFYNYFYVSHPGRSQRSKNISSTADQKLSAADSFWAGIAIGLMGVIIAAGCLWYSLVFNHYSDEIDHLKLSFFTLGMAAPVAIGYLAIFVALPVWSSVRSTDLGNRFILSLFTRYVVVLAGSVIICTLAFTSGASPKLKLTLALVCLAWCGFMIAFGLGVNIIIISLWVTMRYLQSSHADELKKGLQAFGLFAAAALGLVIFGCVLVDKEMIFAGSNIIFSTVIAGAMVSIAIRGSIFSTNDLYIIFCIFSRIYKHEGKLSRAFIYAAHSVHITALLFIFTSIIYLIIDFTVKYFTPNPDSLWIFFTFLITSVFAMLALERNGLKRVSENKRLKTSMLYHCLQLLGSRFEIDNNEKIARVIDSYDLRINNSVSRPINLTIQNANEVYTIISESPVYNKTIDNILNWVLQCQDKQGFGIWPGSSPRLYSTYLAVSMLNDADMLDKCKNIAHISWINSLYQPHGTFKSPYSNRKPWQDTFYATQSIKLLGGRLDNEKALICRKWCENTLKQGIKQDRLDLIYYCFAALKALEEVEEGILALVSDKISSKFQQLLLTNVSLDYENVHLAIMIYRMLEGNIKIPHQTLDIITDRVQTALKAELDNIKA